MQDAFIKSRRADAAFTGFQFAAFGSGDNHVTPAAGPNVPLAGVADSLPCPAGQMVDVLMTQLADIQLGGTVAAGDRLMSDANGHAVTAAKQAGATVYVGGIAQVAGVVGDIIPALVVFDAIYG